MRAWNHWYHVTSWTYGQWLRGDPRGWRARHHREHCDGDYRHRPHPAAHTDQLRLSRDLMRRPPVLLAAAFRQTVVDAIVARLMEFDAHVLAAAMGGKHLHVLGRFAADDPRGKLGIAKQAATKSLKAHCAANDIDLGLALGDGIWAKRSHAEPIRDRRHQVATLYYVVRHVDEGAALWLAPALQAKREALIATARTASRKAHG